MKPQLHIHISEVPEVRDSEAAKMGAARHPSESVGFCNRIVRKVARWHLRILSDRQLLEDPLAAVREPEHPTVYRWSLVPWLLVLAALAWPLEIASRRLPAPAMPAWLRERLPARLRRPADRVVRLDDRDEAAQLREWRHGHFDARKGLRRKRWQSAQRHLRLDLPTAGRRREVPPEVLPDPRAGVERAHDEQSRFRDRPRHPGRHQRRLHPLRPGDRDT